MSDFQKLKGKTFEFAFDGERYDGIRRGRVVGVNAGPRKGLTSLRVAVQTYEGKDAKDGRERWKWGRRYLLSAAEARASRCGVVYRGKTLPIDQFLASFDGGDVADRGAAAVRREPSKVAKGKKARSGGGGRRSDPRGSSGTRSRSPKTIIAPAPAAVPVSPASLPPADVIDIPHQLPLFQEGAQPA